MLGAGPPEPRRARPVPLPLERVRRQRDPPAPLPGEEALEEDRQPRLVGGPGRRREVSASVSLHARNHGRIPSSRPGERRHRTEDRARTDLYQETRLEFRQRPERRGEPHRFPRLPPPVVRLRRPGEQATAQVAHQRNGRRRGLGNGRLQRGEHRLQQRTVEGVTGREPLRPDPHPRKPGEHRRHLLLRTAHHAVRAVLGRERHRTGQRLRHTLHRREHRGHHASRRQRTHERSPPRREPQPVLHAEHARRTGRRDLAHAVPEHRVGTHPDAAPERRQPGLERTEGRLRPLRPVESFLRTEHHRQQGALPVFPERRLAPVQHLPEHRLALVQLPAHPRPLAPLARIEERNLPPRRRRPSRPFRHRPELLPQLLPVPEHEPGAVREVAPAHSRRPCRVPKGLPVPFCRLQPTRVPPRQLGERHRRPCRERQDAVSTFGDVCFASRWLAVPV